MRLCGKALLLSEECQGRNLGEPRSLPFTGSMDGELRTEAAILPGSTKTMLVVQ